MVDVKPLFGVNPDFHLEKKPIQNRNGRDSA